MDISGAVSSAAVAIGASQTGNAVDARQTEEVRESQPQEQVQPVEESAPKTGGNTIDVYA